MKICIVSTFDHNYVAGGITLFKSIKRHTNCGGIDFKVITSDSEVVKEFGIENCHFVTDEIKSRYSNVRHSKDLPKEAYSHSWYRYEIFNFKGYDRVICIDADCLCIEDISYIFSEELNQYDFISVEDHIVSKLWPLDFGSLEVLGLSFRNVYNRMKEGKVDAQTALIIANNGILNDTFYKGLLNYANSTEFTYSLDQGILNDFIYLSNLRIKLLPLEWDYQDLYGMLCPMLSEPDKPIIVHCQQSKPFKYDKSKIDTRIHKWYDKWWEESCFNESDISH